MRTVSLAVVLAVALIGCKSDKPAKPASSGVDVVKGSNDMIVQPGRSEDGTIGFAITKVIPKQKPTETAPFHADGGDWTYVEAHLDGDAQATFVVGLPVFASSEEPGFGKIMMAPTTAAAGARVIQRLAAGLGVDAPPPITGGTLAPMEIPVAVLGHNIGRDGGGYSGSGWWDATKLFCSTDDVDSAELFFNISTADFRGEFSEKDVDYDADVVACLAIALEGAPPPRTPANDPTMAATGPHLELGTRIGDGIRIVALTAQRGVLIEERGTSAALLALDITTGVTTELYTTKDRLDGGGCDDTATRCVVRMSKPSEGRNVSTSGDTSKLVFLDGAKASPISLAVLGDRPEVPAAPVSPDGRYAVAIGYTKPGTKLIAFDPATGKSNVLDGGGKSLETVGWKLKDGKPIAIVTRTDYSADDDKPVVLEWNIAAGTQTETSAAPPPAFSPTSPDGSRHADFATAGKLTVTAGGQTRTLVFHPQDARWADPGCCAWIDNRYLQFRTGFIDTDAMKVFFPPRRPGATDDEVTYIPGTHTALVYRDDGAYLATLVVP